jgi:hypothetical protein
MTFISVFCKGDNFQSSPVLKPLLGPLCTPDLVRAIQWALTALLEPEQTWGPPDICRLYPRRAGDRKSRNGVTKVWRKAILRVTLFGYFREFKYKQAWTHKSVFHVIKILR